MMEKRQERIQARVDDNVAEGTYSNLLNVIFSQAEFILDFGRLVPGKREVKIVSRIITSPMHLKRFVKILEDNIKQYEDKFGSIKDFDKKEDGERIGF
ncbi:MAG TPA: DUF3467 domain-containing protein [Firmicutes bacterium]|uniref:DUF3467 domain-containing protein n=1 Tax=Candidatus Coatesbacteria bacterium 4484_99 TaxID=1970774 RepID=A0A1W9S0U7_9BACT|nr:MAG: hypothetical protein B6D57_02985 [Candidatus Coatesbacteria bacterium 4484_99]RLC42374.1 MAG: DUF3467 domain-containing protein [Candidatus Coatesbacteria bacterium]RLC43255.1 MAG: DUF3467 domain-containing protein [Candidatus Coatesbacteria bacterium]HDM43301.1 DUF3467 domain-containing protein [Bacillota bacterium]